MQRNIGETSLVLRIMKFHLPTSAARHTARRSGSFTRAR